MMKKVVGSWSIRVAAVVFIVSLLCAAALGETWYVNNETGQDTFDGLSAEALRRPAVRTPGLGDGVHGPFATFKRAISTLKTSDRLEIARTSRPYREMLMLGGVGGTPDKPLVVEGNGATIDGLDVVPAAQWKAEPDGTFSTPFKTNANKLERVKDVMTWIGAPQIWFVDGQPAPNAKSAEDLAKSPGGFYWNKGEHKLYLKPPAGKKLEDLRIEVPMRGTGISVHGTDYVVVQNFRSVHSLNDGVGTGNCTGVVFRNIDGSDNCDQGFSAHNGAVNIIEDCRFERNAGSGICDVNNSVTIFRRCSVAHNTFESGAYFLNEGFHVMEDCVIADNDDGPQVMIGADGWVQLRNCVVSGKPGNAIPLIESKGGSVKLDNCTIADGVVGVQMDPAKGLLKISNSIFARCSQALAVVPKGAEARFGSNYNGWHLGVLDFGGIQYTAQTWPDYQKTSKQDANSLTADPQFTGADTFDLPPDSPYLKSGDKGRRIGAFSKLPK